MNNKNNNIKINKELVIRMFNDHNYSIDDIVLRLRYPKEIIELVIKNNGSKNANK